MKKNFSLMWRGAMALMMVLSLNLVMAAPAAAATVGTPTVTFATGHAEPEKTGATYTIKFVSGAALTYAGGDTITIEFPAGTTLGSIVGELEGITITGSDYTVVGQRVRITVPSAGANTIAGETVNVVLTGGIDNPPEGNYELKVYTSQESTAVTSATYMISEEVTTPGVTPTPTTVGVAATYAVTFTTTVALREDDKIVITFPVDTDISAVVTGDVTGVTVASATPVGQVLTIILGADLSATGQTVTIANITNPTTLLNPDPDTNNWTLTVYTTYGTGIGGERIPVESSTYNITDPAAAIYQVVWSVVDDYVPNVTPSTEFKIQTQTQYGTPVSVTSATTFALTASSGAFYSDSGGNSVITTISFSSGSESAAFYYKGATATLGTVTITADEDPSQGWTIASTTILVNPKLELWGGGVMVGEYNTFAAAMVDALPDDTIKVAPSTYDAFNVTKPDLTIESTAGAATTIIKGGISLTAAADDFVLGGASGKGFTLQHGTPGWNIQIYFDAQDVTISWNTFVQGKVGAHGIIINNALVTGLTVTQNTFTLPYKWGSGILVSSDSAGVVGLSVTYNTFTGAGSSVDQSGIELHEVDISSVATTISNNTFTAMQNGILIGSNQVGLGLKSGGTAGGPLTISDNSFTDLKYAIDLVKAEADHDHKVVITRNTFTGNTIALGLNKGGAPEAGNDFWNPEDMTVQYNDFIGNTYGVYNDADVADALVVNNNYWGSSTGPSGEGSGTGDAIGSGTTPAVTATSWLHASGGVALTASDITLYAGWNLISLPLIPIDTDIDIVLAGVSTDVTVIKAAYFTGGPAGSWQLYTPTAGDLTTMNAGKGYWIDISGTGTLKLVATGVALALPGQAPPTYDVVAGWNLIGYTGTATPDASVYLGAVMTSVQAMYAYDASSTPGVYVAIASDTALAAGNGYWLAVDTAGTIYP